MDPFVGEIKTVGFTFAPRGFATCNGQLMAISQNTALFSLLGTNYGGDGRSTFALPDLRGRTPVTQGQGPGLLDYAVGEMVGVDAVALIPAEMPAHSHTLNGANVPTPTAATQKNAPAASEYMSTAGPGPVYAAAATPPVTMANTAIAPAGSGGAHTNRQPYLGLQYVIALQGVFPARN